MAHPFLFLTGYRTVTAERSDAARILNICSARGFVYRRPKFSDTEISIDCSYTTAKRLLEACRAEGIEARLGAPRGLFGVILRYRHRYGVFIGAVLFLAIIFFSSLFVWDVRVQGNRTLDDGEVCALLEECGLCVGDRISELDTASVELRAIVLSDTVSWISVNMIGTVAEVEIREVEPLPENDSDTVAANLVAARDGTVELFEDVRGNIAVKIGDTVSKGELLVGGIYESAQGTVRYTRARGKVYARTARDFEVVIPYEYEKKVYTGEQKAQKSLIFFKKEVNFFANSRNSYATCDTIDTVEYFELPGGIRLPIGVRTVRYLEYSMQNARRSAESAEELARYRLRCLAESEVPQGMLVAKTVSSESTESAYVLRCRAEYIEDIARTEKIDIELPDKRRK